MQKSSTACWSCDAREQFEKRGFTRSIATHDTHNITYVNFEAYILERPEVIGRGHTIRGLVKDLCVRIWPPKLPREPALDLVDQHLAVDHAQAVFFREIFNSDS